MSVQKPIALIGAGGHAGVLLDILLQQNFTCVAVVDKTPNETLWNGFPLISERDFLSRFSPNDVDLVLGLGSLPNNHSRKSLYAFFKKSGFNFKTLIHPFSSVSPSASLGEGTQVMAGAIVQANVVCADNVIINTRASVDHDVHVSAHSHIAPSATLCGQVKVGEHVYVGASSTLIQGVSIGHDSVIAAGAVVVNDIQPFSCVKGCPAKPDE
ncbi:UDP-perosamine 4-acetyltransferase [Alteromonas sp. 76-1]|jgi:sugar O-acyltransferase (sialic acid O-acetyltransferase NeuD family)|uniref:acetyltransferase n=1 Tax=Alteromonas sp. 76-1 TaxID=2358187 RepID=UPI000FD16104|nr:acetyltransferase [Alteromonas sp. 76-1]VEL96067.1 UDP-perosamine 4-acetyltransferase [Alteromonas sp. 76-1]|tara:strand:+ start:14033 stop:14668 length:636 start_codon:yes stop_codon:yes gene_type:complete